MRILIVDDDYVSRTKLVTLLSAHGQCDAVPNGELALMMFQEAHKELVPYDLVTLDVEMPQMTGQEVVGRMRSIEEALQIDGPRQVKVLMVTVKKELKDVSSAYEHGCTGYITKPVTPESLNKALAEFNVIS